MKINKNNYEEFLLDYSEGNLSTEKVAELLLFLESNPEIKAEFELFERDLKIEPEEVSVDLNVQKVLETEHSDEELIIAYLEGDLSLKEAKFVEERIDSEKSFKSLFLSFQSLQLKPEKHISFDRKDLVAVEIDSSNHEELFIAYHERDLSPLNRKQVEEYALKNDLNVELKAYSKIKLIANESEVYPNKNELKRKEARVIPLFAWVSSAAALFLLFFVLNQGSENQEELTSEQEIKNPIEQLEAKVNSISKDDEVVPLVEEKEVEIDRFVHQAYEAPKKQKEKAKTVSKVEDFKEKIETPFVKQDLAKVDEVPKLNIELEENRKDKEVEVPQEELEQDLRDDEIAAVNEPMNQSPKEYSNTLNIITLAENATKNSELISFNSNLNETAAYNETTFSIGKFSFKRKTKRKNKS